MDPETLTPDCDQLSYPHLLNRIWRKLSYSLHLLIEVVCFISLQVDHGWWFAAKGGMCALLIVGVDPLPDACLCL